MSTTTTRTFAQRRADARRTKAYASLIAADLSDKKALKALGVTKDPAKPAKGKAAKKAAAKTAAAKPVSATDKVVAKAGLVYGRGRVYVTGDAIEAAARVRKGGSPEVVTSSGVGRAAAVVVFKTESGDVAIQTLVKPRG